MAPDAFCETLVTSGARRATAQFLLEQIQPYYPAFLAPDPSDRWEQTMRIDPEEMGDIADRYFQQFDIPLPPRSEWPIEMPADPTMAQFASWLDDQAIAAGR